MEKKKLLPCLWEFFIIIKEFPGPAFSLTAEHAHLPVLREKVHLTTYSLCMLIAFQDLKRQNKTETEQLNQFIFSALFFSCAIALDEFGATFIIWTSAMQIKMKAECRGGAEVNLIWSLYPTQVSMSFKIKVLNHFHNYGGNRDFLLSSLCYWKESESI